MHKQIESYITRNYYELLQIAKNITKGHELAKDLLHEVVLQLYDKNEIKLNSYEDNNIKYFIVAIIRTNWYSKTSPFYYKIRRESALYTDLKDVLNMEDEQETFEKEHILCILEDGWADLDWFHKSLFEMYMCLGSMNKVSKKTKIPLSSIRRYIKESKLEIIDKFKNRDK
jgi:hydroxymethylpyrimidine pyrophosphatase-like HAD family hydrolase